MVMENCVLCGGDTIYETRDRVITYKDISIVIKQPATYCNMCSKAFLSPEDSKASIEAVADYFSDPKQLFLADTEYDEFIKLIEHGREPTNALRELIRLDDFKDNNTFVLSTVNNTSFSR
jgi:YgiT-type zinc finger domain-containing protein